MEPENPLLDEFVLAHAPVENPRVCLLPTASGDHPEYIQGFYEYFGFQNCRPVHFSVKEPPTYDIESFLLESHIIYVTGGHTGQMLRVWKQLGIDKILRKAWETGILLAGVSAGATCWFEMGLTDSVPDTLSGEPCLGFLKGSHCAHYENPERRPTFHQLIAAGELPDGYGTDNCAALYFVGDQLKEVVASRPGYKSHRVTRVGDNANEEVLETRFLATEFTDEHG